MQLEHATIKPKSSNFSGCEVIQLAHYLCLPAFLLKNACKKRKGANTSWATTLLQGTFPTQGWNPGLLHCRQILHRLSHQGSPVHTTATAKTSARTAGHSESPLELGAWRRTDISQRTTQITCNDFNFVKRVEFWGWIGGDGGMMMWMYLMPLNCTHKNG